ncbi:hypothetical protein [Thermoactinomyces mirandus]|uniref:Uncharacterized protein n=1 Tax=Thermoactinomyces mirandus TaxID=2756294 RepID=A0A7W1XTJ1_9BACL|nr:hypothetical protein [Thermoactinomyces mirandus]MBA4603018.1 hypothetical protein [Thermoactinomyces mirandus]
MYQTVNDVKMIEEKAKKEQADEKKARRVVQEATKTNLKHENKNGSHK